MEALRDKSNNLCRYFLNGNCTRGTQCNFSHDLGSASSIPMHSAPAAPSQGQVCRYFLRGCCSYGDQCRYAHVRGNEASQGKPGPSFHPGGMGGMAPTPLPEQHGYVDYAAGGGGNPFEDDKMRNRKPKRKDGGPDFGGRGGGRGRGGRGGRGRGDGFNQQRAMLEMVEGGGDFTYPRHPKLGHNMHKYAPYLQSGEIGIDDLNSAMWHWSSDSEEDEGPMSELEMMMAMAMLSGDDNDPDPFGRYDPSDSYEEESDGINDLEIEGAFSGKASPVPVMTKKDVYAEDVQSESQLNNHRQGQPLNFEHPD